MSTLIFFSWLGSLINLMLLDSWVNVIYVCGHHCFVRRIMLVCWSFFSWLCYLRWCVIDFSTHILVRSKFLLIGLLELVFTCSSSGCELLLELIHELAMIVVIFLALVWCLWLNWHFLLGLCCRTFLLSHFSPTFTTMPNYPYKRPQLEPTFSPQDVEFCLTWSHNWWTMRSMFHVYVHNLLETRRCSCDDVFFTRLESLWACPYCIEDNASLKHGGEKCNPAFLYILYNFGHFIS